MRYRALFVLFFMSVVGCAAPWRTTNSSLLPSPTLVPPTQSLTLPTPTPRQSLPSPTPQFHERRLLGYSQEGRPIVAHRFGCGKVKVALVGDIHGGTEENTYRLMIEVVTHYQESSTEVPSEVTLWIIPTINPDGLASDTRFNARGVDLNRNADTDQDGCLGNDWSPDVFDSEGQVPGAGGKYPFSEVETRTLRDFLVDAQVVISYHSQAGLVLAGGCGEGPSRQLAHLLAEATGYKEAESIGYPVTGNMADYLAFRGVAAAEVELTNKSETELERNLEGSEAVMESIEEIVSRGH
ncbi:MAG: M14 family metallopeptidase [Anaerolineae bacterium]|nr:M14 family metallopeptidase [Anaerolineae bacterium]